MLIKLKYYGMEFSIDINIDDTSTKSKKSIDITRVNAAKMIRQFIKQKYPKQFKSWVKSESYSGGSSINVNLCNFDGTPIDEAIFNEIETFSKSLKAGWFNGMIDSYEYNESSKSDIGTLINMYTKFVFVSNEALWGSKEYRIKEQAEA